MTSDWYDVPALTDLVRIGWRLGMAAFLGALVGIEREWMRKAAGLRTHTTVALASAAFVLIAIETGAGEGDVSRVIQGVAAGIGFIGAGTILKRSNEEDIQGLTTAATIWLTAAIGAAAGAGHSEIALVCVVAAWVILVILAAVERLINAR